MSLIIYTEIKNDLESVYKNTSEMITLLQDRNFDNENAETRDLIEFLKFKLMDIEGTVQKDIFTCDYISTKDRTKEEQ